MPMNPHPLRIWDISPVPKRMCVLLVRGHEEVWLCAVQNPGEAHQLLSPRHLLDQFVSPIPAPGYHQPPTTVEEFAAVSPREYAHVKFVPLILQAEHDIISIDLM